MVGLAGVGCVVPVEALVVGVVVVVGTVGVVGGRVHPSKVKLIFEEVLLKKIHFPELGTIGALWNSGKPTIYLCT